MGCGEHGKSQAVTESDRREQLSEFGSSTVAIRLITAALSLRLAAVAAPGTDFDDTGLHHRFGARFCCNLLIGSDDDRTGDAMGQSAQEQSTGKVRQPTGQGPHQGPPGWVV